MFLKHKDEIKLDKLIDSCIRELHEEHEETSDDYAQVADQLMKLYKMKADIKPRQVSPDTLALIGANLIGIFAILKHERIDIITSKAMTHVMKPR